MRTWPADILTIDGQIQKTFHILIPRWRLTASGRAAGRSDVNLHYGSEPGTKFNTFEKPDTYPALKTHLGARINIDLIRDNWDELLRWRHR